MRDQPPHGSGHRSNGRPAPNGRPRPTLNGVPRLGGAFTSVLPAEDEGPLDLVAVQADDELVGVLGARPDVSRGTAAGGGELPPGDDRLVSLFRAWREEIDAEPIPELVDLDAAVAAVLAGVREHDRSARRRDVGRIRRLAPVAAAAAVIVATLTGVGVGSQDALPGDRLWAIQKVVNPERAESVEAKVAVEGHLEKVRTALQQGDTVTAARELEAIRTQIPEVRGQEGQPLLVQEQEFLAAKLVDTPPGTRADLSTPPRSNPAALSTTAPAPPRPAPVLPASSVPASGSSTGAPVKPAPPAPPAPPVDPAVRSSAPAPAAPPPAPDKPVTTREPEAPPPTPNPEPAPPQTEGSPAVDPPAPPAPPASGANEPTPDPGTTPPGTATASGSAGTDGPTTATT